MMKVPLKTLALFLFLCSLATGCGEKAHREVNDSVRTVTDTLPKESDLTLPALRMADSILKGMSRDEKIAQLIMPALYASDDIFTIRAVKKYGERGFGGIVLLKGTGSSASLLADTLRKFSKTLPFLAIDAEWGLGMRLSDEPVYPFNSEIADTVSEEDMYRYGRAVGEQCRNIGINMVLGPVVDVAERSSFMGKRSYGPDPRRVSDLSVAYARGLESESVISVAKHFPGHGSAKDSHHAKPIVWRTLSEMDSVDLYPFRKYIASGLSAVMVGHIAVPALDPDLQPAAVSHAVITGLLLDDLGFKGLVLTDAMNMGGAEGKGADKAIAAGADIILAPESTSREILLINEAMQRGDITDERIDSSVRKILFYKALMLLRKR